MKNQKKSVVTDYAELKKIVDDIIKSKGLIEEKNAANNLFKFYEKDFIKKIVGSDVKYFFEFIQVLRNL